MGHGKPTSTIFVKVHWAGQIILQKLVVLTRKLVQYCQWKFSSTKSVPAVISKYYHILFILCRRIPYCLADLSSQAVLSVGKLEKGNDAGFKKIQVDGSAAIRHWPIEKLNLTLVSSWKVSLVN